MKSNSSQKLYAAKTMARGFRKDEAMEAEQRVLALGRQCSFLASLHCSFSTSVSSSRDTCNIVDFLNLIFFLCVIISLVLVE